MMVGSMNPPFCRHILHEEDTHPKTYGYLLEEPLKGWIETYSLPLFALLNLPFSLGNDTKESLPSKFTIEFGKLHKRDKQ